MAIDTDAMAAGLNPSGIDPEIEKKAKQYSKADWDMTVKPMLDKVFPAGSNHELPVETIIEIQQTMLENKIEALTKSSQKKLAAEKAGLLWP